MLKQQFIEDIEKETSSLGFTLIKDKVELDRALGCDDNKKILVLINSLCKCAGVKARNIVSSVLSQVDREKVSAISIFAGVDSDVADYFSLHTKPYPLSSPSIAIFEDGELLFFIERHEIQSIDSKEIIDILLKMIS